MKKTMAFFTVMALAALIGCGKDKEAAAGLVIQNYIGTVTIQSAGGSRPAEIGGSVVQGDTIVTGGASGVDLVYNETALLRIDEQTTVRVDSIMAGLNKSTDLALQKGSVFNTVSKLKDDENYRISTPTMVVAVRGTSFRVSSDANTSDTDVLAGTVKVNPVQDGKVVTEISNLVGENNRAEIRRDRVRDIVKNRRIEVAAIRADRMQRLRGDLNRIDHAVVDRLNPGLRKEFRMKLLQMRQDRFEMMEQQRGERIRTFLEKRKQGGARIRERFMDNALNPRDRKELFEKRRDGRNELVEKLREKRDERAEKRADTKAELIRKLQEKRAERAEKRADTKAELIRKLQEKKGQAAEDRKDKIEELKKKRDELLKKRRGGN